MNALHDVMQLGIHFTVSPQQTHGVLGHFQTTDRHTAGVRCLARSEQDTGFLEQVDCLQRGRHVGALGHTHTTILDQLAGILGMQLVLRGTGHGNIALQMPRALSGEKLRAKLAGHFLDTAATHGFQIHQISPVLTCHAFRHIQGAAGVGQRNHLAAQLDHLLCRILGNVAGA